MQFRALRYLAVATLGGAAPLWWPWLSSHFMAACFSIAGAPERALYPALAWTIVAVGQLLIGAAVGAFISILPTPRAWITFHTFLLVGTHLFAEALAPLHALKTVGGWSFEASLVLALLACRSSSSGVTLQSQSSTSA